MDEKRRAIGYICPHCGKTVYGERTQFALNAAAAAVVCDCGRSELTAESDGRSFRITVPCGLCSEEHRAEVSAAAVLEGEGVGLACPRTRQLCCYIGEPRRVQESLRNLELTREKTENSGGETFADSVIMYEVLSELRDMAARDGISCACGGRSFSMEVQSTAVDVTCRACGGTVRVNAATDEDLDRLCCRYTLTIPGRK